MNRKICTTYYSSHDKTYAAVFYDNDVKEFAIEYFNQQDKTTHIQYAFDKTLRQVEADAEDWILCYDHNYTEINGQDMSETILYIACDNLTETCLEKAKRIDFYISKYEFLANQSSEI